jgi:hypothetical protein
MSKPKRSKQAKPHLAALPNESVPSGRFPGNESVHIFARLGDEFLETAKFAKEGFKDPKWPTFQNALQALENYLKAYLLSKGVTLEQARNIGHNLRIALKEAQALGLVVNSSPEAEEAVMKVSDHYADHELRYAAVGEWTLVPPHLVITFVDQVRRDAKL